MKKHRLTTALVVGGIAVGSGVTIPLTAFADTGRPDSTVHGAIRNEVKVKPAAALDVNAAAISRASANSDVAVDGPPDVSAAGFTLASANSDVAVMGTPDVSAAGSTLASANSDVAVMGTPDVSAAGLTLASANSDVAVMGTPDGTVFSSAAGSALASANSDVAVMGTPDGMVFSSAAGSALASANSDVAVMAAAAADPLASAAATAAADAENGPAAPAAAIAEGSSAASGEVVPNSNATTNVSGLQSEVGDEIVAAEALGTKVNSASGSTRGNVDTARVAGSGSSAGSDGSALAQTGSDLSGWAFGGAFAALGLGTLLAFLTGRRKHGNGEGDAHTKLG